MTIAELPIELAHRAVDGLEVALLWCPEPPRLLVAVIDTRTGATFQVPVGEDDNALDVFLHPYAYSAWRGIDYSEPVAETAEAA
jgi:hypothetical protein